MKPILIDALHIHMGGALMILNHLIDRLTSRNVDVVLLKDERCPELRSEYLIRKIHIMSCGEFERKRFYNHVDQILAEYCVWGIFPLQ